ncbi:MULTISPECIES: DUF802 domain-containing protein [Paraburkholderia]|uniref:DUF802 domain-containing protein n=1 Tax=Paraburkholderia TaxID=1822464 RepID=UPI001B2E486B|nr:MULTISPECIES: DUF802 domain-containing protein [Paraburkholderia]MCX4152826.1 DUF802 domain-containing protein [Paraburkholderia aspalathi]MDN7162240.1 DUF802 domain-containing protein [Paraburkholderia sp. SECH2]MDQ6390726.1 DUF802 domain-containing protein [Paraburkholderia aspalathi]CAE6806594.1 hypothetical protein R75465_05197 [Paraburkholderia aspalathi]
MSRYLNLVVFLVGLAAVCWIGGGYVGSNVLALAVTLLIGVCYVAGALELRRYSQATSTLARAVADLSGPPASLGAWLEPLHPSLRNAVRLRVEGERVALPGPALTPYLVGLLVLLGMLGTLLGMVATLRGTGMALESATDLQAIRDSLGAPVKGLGFAFGTSIAGVATSAMLGLLSALCRRERIDAAQLLDVKIATTLRIYSQTHQREESFKLLQRQAEVMPTLVERLQAMMTAIEQQSLALNERQLASQDAFHNRAEATYTRLAASVEQSLKESVAESTRAASAALQPVMAATLAGLARETAAMHDTVTHAVQQQLDGLSTGFEASTATVAGIWNKALEGQQRSNEALTQQLGTSLDRFTETFEQRSAGLLEGVSARLEATAGNVSAAWNEALSRQEQVGEKLAGHNQQALAAAAATFEQHSASLLAAVGQSHTDMQTELASRDQQRLAVWTETLGSMAATLNKEWEQAGTLSASRQQEICDVLAQTARDISAQTQAHASSTIAEIDRLVQVAADAPKAAANLQAELAARDQQRLEAWTAALSSMAATLSKEWEQAGTLSASRQQEICDVLAQTARDISAQTQAHASSTIAEIDRLVQVAADAPKAAANLQAELAARDQQRLAAWTETLGSMATTLSKEWEQVGTRSATRQQEICDTLAQTARDISAQTQAHASSTIAEIGQLVQAASEAPKAAAEVVAELRQKLSDSMVRDTAMLDERSRLLATLETLLDAVNHASTEQRTAVDALVATSADLLDRVSTRFTDKVELETGKLGAVAAQVTGSAVEVASLGEAFGAAVQVFGESNTTLVAHLQRIEAALDKSLARSDEQLAYYVAQAREVIDLSMMSQKQIVEDLQHLAGKRASVGAEAA